MWRGAVWQAQQEKQSACLRQFYTLFRELHICMVEPSFVPLSFSLINDFIRCLKVSAAVRCCLNGHMGARGESSTHTYVAAEVLKTFILMRNRSVCEEEEEQEAFVCSQKHSAELPGGSMSGPASCRWSSWISSRRLSRLVRSSQLICRAAVRASRDPAGPAESGWFQSGLSSLLHSSANILVCHWLQVRLVEVSPAVLQPDPTNISRDDPKIPSTPGKSVWATN